MTHPDLSVLIVTYNSARHISPLLRHLASQLAHLKAEVLVLDNASHDGTPELVEQAHPWVRLIRSDINLGFAAGNNLAARHAAGRLLLLLNPDAVPEDGAIAHAVSLMDAHPDVALAGGRLFDPAGRDQPSARMFPSLLQEALVLSGLAARYARTRWFGHLDRTWADPGQSAPVDWVPGAFAMVRRAVFEQLAGFDERFFLYYEEVDLCRRLRALGHRVMYWPELRIRHVGGDSARSVRSQQVDRHGSQLTLWRARSGLLYYRKHHGWVMAWAVNRLESGWHGLRAWRAQFMGQWQKQAESMARRTVLGQAWNDTCGGRAAPPRPW